jgi:hypothetical protein
MSNPIIELIAVDIETAINAITTAAGYNQTLTAVRPKRSDFAKAAWNDLTVLISQVEPEELAPEMGYKRWRQFFILTCIVIDSDTAETAIDTRLNRVVADITKKLCADIRRSNLADDTNIHSPVPFVDDESAMSRIAIQISVDYRTQENDPYTL